jgi:hypothetical protein
VDRLAVRATTPPASIGDVAGIVALMAGATERGLKRPKIRLRTETDVDLVLTIAGPSSREPGSVLVLGAGPYTDRPYYGRISLTSAFTPSRSTTPENSGPIVAMLQALATDPAGMAAAYGGLTKTCCFCGIGLWQPGLIVFGYGPICAKRFGLPWGARS